MAGNEYDALIPQSPDAQARAVTNEYDSMVVDFTKERSQRTRASIYSAQDANPDTTAKAISLSKKTGIPVDTVERDVKAVEGPAALNDYDALIGKSPGLGRWLEDPVNARVAKDDYESLGMLEKRWVDLKGALFQKQATSGALSALKTTEHLQILEDAKGRRARGEIVPPFQQRMLDNEDTMRAAGLKELTGSLGQYLEKGQAAGELPHNKGVAEMQEAAKTDDWASGMWNAFRKDPLGIIATISTQSAVDLPGQIASGVVAGPAGAGAYSFIQEYVNGVLDVLEDKKVDIKNPAALLGAFSNPTLMEEVRQKAATKAAVVGAFDALSFGVASKTVGFGLKGAKARHIANIPAQVITQGALGGAGEALGSVASGQKVDPFAVFAEVAGEAGMAPAEVGGARTWRSLHTEDVKAGEWAKFKALPPGEQTATLHTMGLDKLVADAQGTKLAGRSPEKLAEFLSTVTGPDQNVFVPVEAVQAYFQSKPVEDIQALSDALGITDQIPEALARGGDVVIPLAKYVTEAGKSDIHKAWREDVRMEADGFSIRQAQEDAKVRDERLKAAVDRFEKQLAAGIAEVDATTRVYEDWRDKLKTAGKFTNEAAEQQAAVFAEHYATRAARNPGSYLDAWDAYSKAGLGTGMEVRSQLSDRVGAYPPDDLDVLLNSIRSGKEPPVRAPVNRPLPQTHKDLVASLRRALPDSGTIPDTFKPDTATLTTARRLAKGWGPEKHIAPPTSLLDFVRKSGGLRNDQPEAADLLSQDIGRQPGLLRSKKAGGVGFDEMARRAQEQGYDIGPDTGIGNGVDANRFMEMLMEDASGRRKHYPDDHHTASWQAQQEYFDEYAKWLKNDIEWEPKGRDAREVAWFLSQDADTQRLMALAEQVDKLGPDRSLEARFLIDSQLATIERDTLERIAKTKERPEGWDVDLDETQSAVEDRPLTLEEFRALHAELDRTIDEESSAGRGAEPIDAAGGSARSGDAAAGNVPPSGAAREVPRDGQAGGVSPADKFRADRADLLAALFDLGLDTKKMSNAQIRAAIKAEVEKRAKGQTYEQPVYHGTPHIFDKFDLSKIGTGEGAQSFGWGLYFAGRKEIAEHYRRVLSQNQETTWSVDGNPASGYLEAAEAVRASLVAAARDAGVPVSFWTKAMSDMLHTVELGRKIDRSKFAGEHSAFANRIADEIEKRVKVDAPGRLYHVDIPEDGAYLHWDKPLSEQSPEVQKAVKKALGDVRPVRLKDGAYSVTMVGADGVGKTLWDISAPTADEAMARYDEWIGTSTGEAIYHQLSRGLDVTPGNSAREASMSLREAGIPGIQYLDGSSRGKGVGAHNYVLFDAGLAEIKSYEQEARGQITFADNLSTITLFQGRDLSTLLHETGHLWLEELGFDAKSLNAPDQIKADYQAVLDWLGSKDGYITRDMHEQFARGFETYLMEGKAPSSALASAFRSFKRWLTQIYKRLTALNSPITPEVRQVFDRLIATDEQIESAQTRQGLNPVFKDAKSAGMTKAEFDAYTKRANAVVDDAEQKLLQSTMDTIRKQRTKEWKADEARVREEVTGEVMSESGQQALALLTKGEFPVGTTPEVLKGIKLTKEDIVSLYGDETVLTMLPAGIYRDRSVGPGTMSPDELAPMLGLDSGKDLIERLMQLEAQHKAQAAKGDKRSVARAKIDEETAQRMAERYGDPLNDGTIEQIAMDAVHSDKQAALMATELRVLAKKAGHTGTITWDDIKAWAAEAIGDKSVREGTKFDQYARAERTAGRKVEQALIKGDFVAAFKAKQDQMVNHALYMEARKASEEVDSARKLMDRYASAATLKGMDQDYLEQIHGLLEDYEFKNRSATLIAERKSFEAWAAEQAALGKEVEPPPRLAKGLGTTNYRDMTVDELRGLVDTVKQIAHLGRNKKDLFLDGKKRELDATLTEMEETAGKGVQRGASLSVRGLSEIEKSVGSAKHWLRVRNSELLKIERLLEFADGDKSGNGIFSRMIYRPIAKADSAKNDRLVELGKKEKAIYEKVPAEQRKLWTQRHTLPELGVKLDKEGIISIALNMGNESNLEKMLLGDKWTEDAVRAVVNKHLTKEEWQFVQDMWDHIDSQWPEFAAVNRDVNGVAPPKVEAVPLDTPYGTLKGGYYPVAYDRRENLKAAKVGEMQDSALLMGMASSPRFGRPTTKAGASNVRTNFNAPLDLSLSVIGKHLDEVVHDIFHRRAVADIYKIISNDRFRETLRSRLGPEYEAQFLPWLQRVSNSARTNNTNLKGWDSAMKALRVNVTAMAMGLRVSTMVQQVAGYAVSMQRLGTKDMLKGMAEFWPNPARATREVFAASGEMRNRANNLERDIKANADKYRGKSTWKANLARFSFRGIALADLSVSVPTWLGAYRKGLAEKMDEADAVAYADKMVRDTQGAGGTKDMSAFQEGTETWKLMSMFYSFLNVFYNAQQGIVEDARTPGKSFSEWADLFWQVNLLMVVSPIMAALLSGQGPGDDEDWLYWAMRQVGFGAFSGIPLVRDLANTLSRDMGGQPSGGFKLSPIQGPLEGSLRLINDLKKAATGEEVGKNFIKNTFNVVGGFTGLPTGQPGVTAQFLYDALISGSENPENIREWLRGLTYGPPHKK